MRPRSLKTCSTLHGHASTGFHGKFSWSLTITLPHSYLSTQKLAGGPSQGPVLLVRAWARKLSRFYTHVPRPDRDLTTSGSCATISRARSLACEFSMKSPRLDKLFLKRSLPLKLQHVLISCQYNSNMNHLLDTSLLLQIAACTTLAWQMGRQKHNHPRTATNRFCLTENSPWRTLLSAKQGHEYNCMLM